MKSVYPWKTLFIGFGVVFCTDQLSKIIAQYYKYASFNNGFSFSLGAFLPVGVIAAVVVVILLFWTRWMLKQALIPPVVIGSFWGAVVSNLFDRLWWGGVRDFLPLPFTGLRNNFADWVIGVVLLWIFIKNSKKRYNQAYVFQISFS